MSVLVLNTGSSSLKYRLVGTDGQPLAGGSVQRVGGDADDPPGSLTHEPAGAEPVEQELRCADHGEALEAVVAAFDEHGPDLRHNLEGVGHRVVQGGPDIDRPRLVDDDLLSTIDDLAELAPLHNPVNAALIRTARTLLDAVPHVAVFDTAFFHDLPEDAATYAIDAATAHRYGIRRYGAHGTSHEYVSRVVAERLGERSAQGGDPLRQVVLHLGNGASAAAVRDGTPVDTSMGFTPLEGLVMGTRSGDLDPAIVTHLQRVGGMDIAAVDDLLNHRSGLEGLCGLTDIRDVVEQAEEGAPAARLALAVYARRIRRYIGGYAAVLGGLDAVTFTAGVGEHNPRVRADALAGLEFLGVTIDERANAACVGVERGEPVVISAPDSAVQGLVVATDEEGEIARQVRTVLP